MFPRPTLVAPVARALATALVIVFPFACTAGQPTVEEAHPPIETVPAEAPVLPEPVTMNFDDTEVALLLRALGTVVQKPVKVDPAAQPLVDCAVVTMRAGRVTPAAAAIAVAAALRPKGLVVAEAAGVIDVRRAPDAAPCPGKH